MFLRFSRGGNGNRDFPHPPAAEGCPVEVRFVKEIMPDARTGKKTLILSASEEVMTI